MKEYIYNGTDVFFYHDSHIAMTNDMLHIDSKGNIVNLESGNKFYSIPEDILADLLSKCQFLKEVEEVKEPLTDIDRFEAITKEMIDTFKRKNHDYGNSFEESLNEEGIAASRIRMGDKWNRFKTLSKSMNIAVNDESITDTLLDMANYCIMTVIWLNKKNM